MANLVLFLQGLYFKIIDIFKKIIARHKLVSAIVVCALIAVIIVLLLFSCSKTDKEHVSGNGAVLSDEYWKDASGGLKVFDKEGFISTHGIDVSQWVGKIDFRSVKKQGFDFVILRAGYRGYDLGGLYPDENLKKYLRDARNAGLYIGVYFVSQAVSTDEAIEEAKYVLDLVKGYNMHMPVYIDMEDAGGAARTDILTRKDFTDVAAAFCEYIESNGFRAGVYANEAWFAEKLIFDKIDQYDIWLAKYTDTPKTTLPVNMWQYSHEGDISGAEHYVDLNVRVDPVPNEEETTG